ncbi:MAG: ATP-binding protein [Spirochaetes bacterium]|nr:ATP-binding protein [Spirochaetota bacterium]
MLNKLSNKLILSFISLTVILSVIIFVLLGDILKTVHINIIKMEMYRYSELISLELKGLSVKPLPSSALSKIVSEFSHIMDLRITIIKEDGSVIADSDITDFSHLENHQYRKEVIDALSAGYGFSTRYSNTLKTDMLYYALNKEGFIIRLSKPLYEIDQSVGSLKQIVFNVTVIILFIFVILIIIISLIVTKPFKDTIRFASDFANGDYKRRFLNYSKDEIGLLQKSLNKMADTIEETINNLILQHKKLEAILHSINAGIAMVDSNKHIVINNDSFLTMLDINTDIRNKQYFEIIRNSTLNSKIEKNLKDGEIEIFETEMYNKYFEFALTPIRKENIIQGILVVLHDISEKKKIEKIKSDIISNVSHELKTPIAIVKGYLETIQENYDNREIVMNFIDSAIDNIDRQNSLIQDIIKLSMIESSKGFEKEIVDLRAIIERCIELLSLKIAKKSITVVNNLKNDIDYSVVGNRFLAEEIFFNIIDNGINYNNQDGTLTIDAACLSNNLSIKIFDTGIGIPQEFRDRIFERFYRVDKSRSRATGGTGLGLSIVKHAIMVMGWDISVLSDRKGSTFIVTVELEHDKYD